MDYRQIQHLWNRAGWGGTPSQIAYRVGRSREELVNELISNSNKCRQLRTLKDPIKGKPVSRLSVLFKILRSGKQMNELNLDWLKMLADEDAALRERMTYFWHGHFATSTPLAWLMQVQNNTLRKHALGNFKTLLHEVAKDPAMIIYLNNQQNKKESPNENFARELLELFALGRDQGYTEQDIKEAARAFTGWSVNMKGEFEKNPKEHDDGEKSFMGKTGNFDGEDIIDILLENKRVSIFISEKVYAELVNTNINNAHVSEMADVFYQSGYNISALLRHTFNSDWFYHDEHIGSHIISPVELIVRLNKLISFRARKDQDMIRLQKYLGQVLMFPPNVAGWKGGRTWIDSSSLMARLNMPSSILRDGKIDFQQVSANEDDPVGVDIRSEKGASVYSDWRTLVGFFSKYESNELAQEVCRHLLQVQPSDAHIKVINEMMPDADKEGQVMFVCAAVMSLPEFQLS